MARKSSVTTAIDTLISVYNKGLIPSGLYRTGENGMPELSIHPESFLTNSNELNLTSEKDPSMREFMDTLRLYQSVFNKDGSFNPSSPIAETYAISLVMDEKSVYGIKMFDVITANSIIIPSKNNIVPPVVNSPSHLGYEGAFQYAEACLDAGNTKRATEIYKTIADVDRKCYAGSRLKKQREPRYEEVRLKSLQTLVNTFELDTYKPLLHIEESKHR